MQAQEEKRRQLLLKARAAKAKKKQARALQCSMNQMLTQRKVAQRQRRERERLLLKQAKDRQDKLNKHKEAEVRKNCCRSVSCEDPLISETNEDSLRTA